VPVKLRASKVRKHRITPDAIAAFERGDMLGLHRALQLRPWQPSPLPLAVSGLGVDDDEPGCWPEADWRLALDLRRELLAAGALMPDRPSEE
jgi:hypothetical protein